MGQVITSLVFQPPPPSMGAIFNTPESKHFWLDTRLGSQIQAFFINRQAPVTMLFSHGNAEDLSMIYHWFKEFSKAVGVNILAYDYTGYGKNRGEPSEEHVYADIEAAWHHLTTTRGLKPSQIILYGRSVGSGATCYMAHKLSREGCPPAGIMLQSPLLSIYRVAFNFRFTLPGDLFPNGDRVPGISCAVFIVHGTRDEVVPFWHGQELFLATRVQWRAKPFWVGGAGHNNIEVLLREDGVLFEKVREFLLDWVPAHKAGPRRGELPDDV